ncbi:hypothetical protein [Elizabethkingia anophelis]|uniref:hypothetical protein n=1 Tax=Elizabethkingia anophelis TaxID=1117645 RepID=UPI000D0284E0|nr:hypothetical protein [Elizabethkingia anophelis]MYY49930.1 hypothetical protein [Elizabethkingia anophelis]PRQ84638.1 hypothetical protein CMT87_08990 [Elizabethkingia anophelis]PRQ85858.1 hypothetical protein CMT86_14305 [Elizabethkingia anophelis]
MTKKINNTNSILDRLESNYKKSDLERSKIALEKAKALNTPMIYLTSSGSTFVNFLEKKDKEND